LYGSGKIAKIGKKFFAESDFWERVQGISQKSDWILAKNPVF
jgi:hypothetical protein